MDYPKNIREEEEEDVQQYAMQLANAAVLPMVLKAAIELDLFDIINKSGVDACLSASEIASRLPLQGSNPQQNLMLEHILRLLTSHSILTMTTSSGQPLYGLAPVARYFLQENTSLAPLFMMSHDKVMIKMLYHLKEAVLEGGVPFERAYNMGGGEYLAQDSRFASIFHSSMRAYSVLAMEKILKDYEGFNGLKSIVDVGGGNGFILNMIVSKYPSIKGINFDLPPVIEKSPSYPGIEHVAGDIFTTIPKGDALFMKWILHHYDDEKCLKVLKNCYKALPDDGKLMVVETVVPEVQDTSPTYISALQLDVFLSSLNHVGKERTAKEYQALAKEAGFSSMKVATQAYNLSLLEFHKK